MTNIFSESSVLNHRSSGVLMPITSLSSPYGVGTMGEEAYRFVDFLAEAGQKYWQVLPLGTTGFGDSPYQNFSTKAGNPYLIDLRQLVEFGLLDKSRLEEIDWGDDATKVDYGVLYLKVKPLLEQAFGVYLADKWGRFAWLRQEFESFCHEQTEWLQDFALFMVLKEHHGGSSWQEWETPFKFRHEQALERFGVDYQWQIECQSFTQFLFFRQWRDLRKYAQSKAVSIIGDIPIYISADSVEIWQEPHCFLVDANLCPSFVAGCPPDYFSADGQLWGNPLYDWDLMAKDGYQWWIKRIEFALALYDVVRIDHFRGFESFWAVPAGDLNARRGLWVKGPGTAIFEAIKARLGDVPLIAEDLGLLTEEVKTLRKQTGIAGMKVLQFAFAPGTESVYLPHNLSPNCVLYIGTHDNDTIKGWLSDHHLPEIEYATAYFGLNDSEGKVRGVIRGAMTSCATLVILQMQDLLELGRDARINAPGKPDGNWTWRMKQGELKSETVAWLRHLTQISSRLSQ